MALRDTWKKTRYGTGIVMVGIGWFVLVFGPNHALGMALILAGIWIYRDRPVEDGARIRAAIGGGVMLGVGIFLTVVNILPDYQVRGGGYYYWSSVSRLLIATGVVLILVAVLTKPKGEPF